MFPYILEKIQNTNNTTCTEQLCICFPSRVSSDSQAQLLMNQYLYATWDMCNNKKQGCICVWRSTEEAIRSGSPTDSIPSYPGSPLGETSLAVGIINNLKFCLSNVASHCDFNLLFSNDIEDIFQWAYMSLNMCSSVKCLFRTFI